jgi:hypothetical protein
MMPSIRCRRRQISMDGSSSALSLVRSAGTLQPCWRLAASCAAASKPKLSRACSDEGGSPMGAAERRKRRLIQHHCILGGGVQSRLLSSRATPAKSSCPWLTLQTGLTQHYSSHGVRKRRFAGTSAPRYSPLRAWSSFVFVYSDLEFLYLAILDIKLVVGAVRSAHRARRLWRGTTAANAKLKVPYFSLSLTWSS